MSDSTSLLTVFKKEDLQRYDLVRSCEFISEFEEQLKDACSKMEQDSEVISFQSLGATANLTDMLLKMSDSGQLVASFNGLDVDTKRKLKKGIYHVAESKQISGEFRACIVDSKNKIVKQLTLRRVENVRELLSNCNNLALQAAVYELSQKLDVINSNVVYLIEFERRTTLQDPFFNARSSIITAANTNDDEYRKQNIRDAITYLREGLNALYSDMESNETHLHELHFKPTAKLSEIDRYVSHITEDVCLIPKYVSLLSYIFNYSGEHENAKCVFDEYRSFIRGLTTRIIGTGKKTATTSELMQMNFPYNSQNLDFWVVGVSDMLQSLDAVKMPALNGEGEHYCLVVEGVDEE